MRLADFGNRADYLFSGVVVPVSEDQGRMKSYSKILFSFLAAVICATAFAADQPACKKSGKNCPMNNGKECNCGKSCDC